MIRFLLPIWTKLDPIYFKVSRLSYPINKHTSDTILRVRVTKYKGRNITLMDGTSINTNDKLVKIHLHNVRLLNELKDVKSDIKKTRILYQYVKQSLPGLDEYIQKNSHGSDIKGVVGITSLTKCCERLGFEVIQISHPFYKKFKWVSFLLINILSHDKLSLQSVLKQSPNYLFLSKQKLTSLYRK
ncbi:YkoP family protein [Aquibacillus saliphilus]|uniref:YkoP family protein n=1 Tax=Aquibacillus saliphilus TaxID=1909422 RepID=UPI001CF049A4|nr:hypothetical protein [Aquibacillus saliphilus]